MVHQRTKLIEWTVPEYVHREKHPDWFWTIGLIALIGVILSAVFGNFLLAVLIFMSGILLILFSNKHPIMMTIEISEVGIQIQNELFPYANIKKFWILTRENGTSKLILQIERFVNPFVSLPIHEDISLEDLREVIMANVTEEEMAEPIGDRISETLGF